MYLLHLGKALCKSKSVKPFPKNAARYPVPYTRHPISRCMPVCCRTCPMTPLVRTHSSICNNSGRQLTDLLLCSSLSLLQALLPQLRLSLPG